MNGMNEVQSSSMVQMPNGLTSSPMNRPMEQERYETIMEVNDGEQTSEVAMSSTFMMPQSTPNRVLQEILVLNPNTPSPLTDTITVVKPPIENPSRDSNDEVCLEKRRFLLDKFYYKNFLFTDSFSIRWFFR